MTKVYAVVFHTYECTEYGEGYYFDENDAALRAKYLNERHPHMRASVEVLDVLDRSEAYLERER